MLVLASWEYAGHGHNPGASAVAATIAHDSDSTAKPPAKPCKINSAWKGGAA